MTGRRRANWGRCRGDAGSASVVALGLAGVAVVVAVVGIALGDLVMLRQRTAATADLAALAAAGRLLAGADDAGACTRASAVADAGGGVLVGCEVRGLTATVEVAARPPALVVRLLTASGHPEAQVRVAARAGPGLDPPASPP